MTKNSSHARIGVGGAIVVAIVTMLVLTGIYLFVGRPVVVPNRPAAPPIGMKIGAVSTSAGSSNVDEPSDEIHFRENSLPFEYERGESGRFLPVETTGGGVGLFDFDQDGLLDIFFAQGVPLDPNAKPTAAGDTLLRNLGDGRFEDVSRRVGLTTKGYGQGVTIGDYDGDGDSDVYVTRWGPNTLWRNDGGRFADVTHSMEVACPLWSLGAVFADFDGDGDLDLFVANYFDFDPAKAPFVRDPATGQPAYGLPQNFPGLPDVLYRNDGKQFTDVTQQAGIAGKERGMGVLAADFDRDGRIDILVANDAEPNACWQNLGDMRFAESGYRWGIAVNADGVPEANMGIASGDVDGDGVLDVLISHFVYEHDTLWRGVGGEQGWQFFVDETRNFGLATDSLPFTGWGTAFADLDRDGWLDLVVANGHIRRESGLRFPYENPPILWHNERGTHFRNMTRSAGGYFARNHLARGLAVGDLDNDGDLDLVIVQHHAKSVVLWNETAPHGNWLGVRLLRKPGSPDATGTIVIAQSGQRSIVREVVGGGSYLSGCDPRLHFGLGAANQIDRLSVRWPTGKTDEVKIAAVNRYVEIHETGSLPGESNVKRQ